MSESSAIWNDTSGGGDVLGGTSGLRIVATATAGRPWMSVEANITFHALSGSAIPNAAIVAGRDRRTVPGATWGIGSGTR